MTRTLIHPDGGGPGRPRTLIRTDGAGHKRVALEGCEPLCCGGSPPPPPGPCCGPNEITTTEGTVIVYGCRPTGAAPEYPIVMRLRGRVRLVVDESISGPIPTGAQGNPTGAQAASVQRIWEQTIDETVVVNASGTEGGTCPIYQATAHGPGFELANGQALIAPLIPNQFQEFNFCLFGFYTGADTISMADLYALSQQAGWGGGPIVPWRLTVAATYSPFSRAVTAQARLFNEGGGAAAPLENPPLLVSAADDPAGPCLAGGIGFAPANIMGPFVIDPTGLVDYDAAQQGAAYPQVADRVCNTGISGAYAWDATLLRQVPCQFQTQPVVRTLAMHAEVECSVDILSGIGPCPETVACPNLPPPPPPPPPPTDCCGHLGGAACKPSTIDPALMIGLDVFETRIDYRVRQSYQCSQGPGPNPGIPDAGSVGRSYEQVISAPRPVWLPVAAVNGCPVYELTVENEDPMSGLIHQGCNQGGFSIPPVSASGIILRQRVVLRYSPGPRTLKLVMDLWQLTAQSPPNNLRPVFHWEADLLGGANPPWGGVARGWHLGYVLNIPGPFGPGDPLPPLPTGFEIINGSGPPGPGIDQGAYGGWGFESVVSPCHTGMAARGAALFVPTGPTLKGNGTVRDDVYFGFSVSVVISGVEECEGGAFLASGGTPLPRPLSRWGEGGGTRAASIAGTASGCPVCGGMLDYSRCGAPCMNKACRFSAGCGG